LIAKEEFAIGWTQANSTNPDARQAEMGKTDGDDFGQDRSVGILFQAAVAFLVLRGNGPCQRLEGKIREISARSSSFWAL